MAGDHHLGRRERELPATGEPRPSRAAEEETEVTLYDTSQVPWRLQWLAASIANRLGVPERVAVAVAAAVLSHYDDVIKSCAYLLRSEWTDERAVTHLRRRLRHDLTAEVADKGFVPIELPREQRRYYAVGPGLGAEVPAAVAEAQPGSWQRVELSLSVRVRTPGIDRERAVETGLLGTREG
jgi:hypothetical protein